MVTTDPVLLKINAHMNAQAVRGTFPPDTSARLTKFLSSSKTFKGRPLIEMSKYVYFDPEDKLRAKYFKFVVHYNNYRKYTKYVKETAKSTFKIVSENSVDILRLEINTSYTMGK